MEIKVKVPAGIIALAKERGLRVEEYVEDLLNRQVRNEGSDRQRPKSREEIRAWLDSLAQFSDKVPPLPETITRDWIYEGHD